MMTTTYELDANPNIEEGVDQQVDQHIIDQQDDEDMNEPIDDSNGS